MRSLIFGNLSLVHVKSILRPLSTAMSTDAVQVMVRLVPCKTVPYVLREMFTLGAGTAMNNKIIHHETIFHTELSSLMYLLKTLTVIVELLLTLTPTSSSTTPPVHV